MDCRLQNAAYGVGIKHGMSYETRTKHYGLGIKHGLSMQRGLRTKFDLLTSVSLKDCVMVKRFEKFSLNFSMSLFEIRVNLLHP